MSTNDSQLVIEAEGLKKVFRDFWMRPKAMAVNGIDFQVKAGDVIGFLGPNGSGKSTTIKMILGLLYPSGGNLQVFGRSPRNVEIKKRIGYLPEETFLYKYLTAAETLDFFGALFNLSKAERQRRTRELLHMVGLAHAAHRPVGEFSKGMARRIGLAQALINDPDLIILDEPTSGLDPIGCEQVKDIIRLLAKRKKTVILCSHLLADVEDICDSVMIMYGGKIRARGPLSELLTQQDRTRIQSPALTPDQLERVMHVLSEMPPEAVQVDNPKLELEDFFMQVVNSARKESAETAGATSEGKIASYLTGSDNEEGAEAILRDLVKPVTQRADEEAAAKATVESEEPKPDLSKLASLTGSDAPEPPKVPSPQDAPKPEPTAAEKEAANKAIQDLLNKK